MFLGIAAKLKFRLDVAVGRFAKAGVMLARVKRQGCASTPFHETSSRLQADHPSPSSTKLSLILFTIWDPVQISHSEQKLMLLPLLFFILANIKPIQLDASHPKTSSLTANEKTR